jgi:hypothetical protein
MSMKRRRDSSVGMATSYGLDDKGIGVGIPVGARFFSYPCRPEQFWGPPSLLSMDIGVYFPRDKAAGT